MRPHEPLSREFEEERIAIVGNFQRTLQECEALLERNKQFRIRDSNVLENLRYNLGKSEVQVDQLRSRLHFHAQKIRLVLDRLSINLLTNIDDKVDDILAISEQNLRVSEGIELELKKFHASWLGHVSGHGVPSRSASEGLHSVSASIAQRFEDTIRLDAPADLTNGVPLIEGFDALLLHFERSSEEGSDQTPEGYLLFLKARWLLDQIKAGVQFQNARPGLYYKRAINQVEQAMLARISQPGQLIAYDESVLLQLPETCFHIWLSLSTTPSVEYSKPSPLMIRGGEVKVAHIKLASENPSEGSVTIFKSSDEQIRVVHESIPASASERVVITQHNVLVQEDKLIPRYTFPTLTTPCLELDIRCRNVDEYFKFTSIDDLHNFQRALMGYEVSHDQSNIICQFSDHLSHLDCKGHVQLWQEPIGLASSMPGRDDVVSPLLGSASISSGGSRHDSLSSSIAATSTVNAAADGWQADPIKKASIVIFAQLTDSRSKNKRFAAVNVDLGESIYVDPSSCQCHRDPDCKSVVLRHKKSTKFSVHALFSESDAMGQPNPSTFDIFPFRLPRHPDRASRVQTKQTEYLVFAFKTIEEKTIFLHELNIRFAVRDQQIKDQWAFESSIRWRQEHPVRHRHQSHGSSLSSSPGSRHMSQCSTSPSTLGRMSSRTHPRHTSSISSSSGTMPITAGAVDEAIASPRRQSSNLTAETVVPGSREIPVPREALEPKRRGINKIRNLFS